MDRIINEMDKSKQQQNAAGGGGAGADAKSDDGSVSAIQKPITATKSSFCYLGTFEGKRGCVQVESGDVCQSGRLFDARDQCLSAGDK